ncbi:putative thiamine transporter SLC35F3 [Triplophysa tibetana]|uniref:Putative thiamine transporter SLC35F3 n=1 Tax=Triplophysa tibetana TaxID=1572043 RepID=A0A5A9N4C2_9TELE|nr:putative thiamine transporter SLC35F3 [Triplophysa tibetana]
MNKLSARISPAPGPVPIILQLPTSSAEKEPRSENILLQNVVSDDSDTEHRSQRICARCSFRAAWRIACGIVLGACLAVSWAWGTHNAKETLLRHPAPFFIIWFCSIWNIVFFPFYYLCQLLVKRQKEWPTAEFRECSRFLGEELTVRTVLKGAAPFSMLWSLSGYLSLLALCHISKVDVSAVLCCGQAFVFLLSWIGLKDRFMGVRIVAVILSITGIVMMAYADGFNSDSITGVALGVGSASTSAFFKVLFRNRVGDVQPGPVSVLFSCVGLCSFVLHSWVCVLLYLTHVEYWPPSQHIPWDKLCVMASLLLVFNMLVNLGGIFTYPSLISLGILLTIPASAAVDTFVTSAMQISHVRVAAAVIISAGFLMLQLPENWDDSTLRWLSTLWHGNWHEDSIVGEEIAVDLVWTARAKPAVVTVS